MAAASSPVKYEVISEPSEDNDLQNLVVSMEKRKSKTENYHDNGNCLVGVKLYFRYINLVSSQM